MIFPLSEVRDVQKKDWNENTKLKTYFENEKIIEKLKICFLEKNENEWAEICFLSGGLSYGNSFFFYFFFLFFLIFNF
jgi:hypothetical protein